MPIATAAKSMIPKIANIALLLFSALEKRLIYPVFQAQNN
jgi:hypothetical protein